MARDYSAERAGRDAVARAEGYGSYNQRAYALKLARGRGDVSRLKGADAANPAATIVRGQNVAGLARVKVTGKGTKAGAGRRSADAVARRARADGGSVEVRYVLDGRSGPIEVSAVFDPDDLGDDPDWVDVIEGDADDKYSSSSSATGAGGGWTGAVLSFTVAAR